MTPTPPSPIPAEKRATQRNSKLLARNQKIRELFEARFTNQPKPRIYTREGVIAKLAEDFYLSMGTVENIIYKQAA